MSAGEIVVLVVAGSVDDAARIGRTLVEERLAACANVVPEVRSIYRWKGEIADEREALLLLKTRRALFVEIERRIRELHPYDTPEVVALEIAAGSERYLSWVRAETSR
ncbi:MAG: periplasmic divalent cation tolerance protein [Candidatus Binatota bacterium]|nr:periplasmic divalent cation tolerance protein [Candidatus Binatota bacterium]